MGVAQAGIWGPLATLATRNLPLHQAGAGSGVYNTTRQIGAVIGSAAISALVQARLIAEIPGYNSMATQSVVPGQLPDVVAQGFADAMSQATWLPIIATLVAAVVTFWFEKPRAVEWGQQTEFGADAAAAAAH